MHHICSARGCEPDGSLVLVVLEGANPTLPEPNVVCAPKHCLRARLRPPATDELARAIQFNLFQVSFAESFTYPLACWLLLRLTVASPTQRTQSTLHCEPTWVVDELASVDRRLVSLVRLPRLRDGVTEAKLAASVPRAAQPTATQHQPALAQE